MTKGVRRIENRFERFGVRLMCGLSLVLFSLVVQAQRPSIKEILQQPPAATPVQSPQESAGSRRIQALRVTEEIKIDGLLNESVWSLAQPANDFLQQQPNEGVPAS